MTLAADRVPWAARTPQAVAAMNLLSLIPFHP